MARDLQCPLPAPTDPTTEPHCLSSSSTADAISLDTVTRAGDEQGGGGVCGGWDPKFRI